MGNEFTLEATVELQTAASEASLRRLTANVDQVNASMAKAEKSDYIQKLQAAFAQKGTAGATQELEKLSASLGGVDESASHTVHGLHAVSLALDGNFYALSRVASAYGMYAMSAMVGYEIGSKLATLVIELGDKFQDHMGKLFGMGDYYSQWSQEVHSASAAIVLDYDRVAKGAENLRDRVEKSTAKQNADQARTKRLASVANEYAEAFDKESPREGVDRTRDLTITQANDRKTSAAANIDDLRKQKAALDAKAAQAQKIADDFQAAAFQNGDLGAINAHMEARGNARKLKEKADQLGKSLDDAIAQQVAVIADANADIETANAKAAINKHKIDQEEDAQRGKDAKSLQEARKKQADYQLSQRPPEEQLAIVEKRISATNSQLKGNAGPVNDAEEARLVEERLSLVKERARLQADIAHPREHNAEQVTRAQDQIGRAKERVTSAADLHSVFQRQYDIKAGRTPQDDPAKASLDALRLIAENTKVIAQLSGPPQ